MKINEEFVKFVEISTRNSALRHPSPLGMQYAFIFDIDDTLYQSDIVAKMDAEMAKNNFMSMAKVTEEEWLKAYLSTNSHSEMFYKYCGIRPSDYHREFKDPEFHIYLRHDLELIELLEKVEHRLFCFTNGPLKRAKAILEHLKIDHLFENIFCADVEGIEFILKPSPDAFKFVEDYLGVSDPKKIYFFDDSRHNIKAAEARGWNSIHANTDIKILIKNALEDLSANALNYIETQQTCDELKI